MVRCKYDTVRIFRRLISAFVAWAIVFDTDDHMLKVLWNADVVDLVMYNLSICVLRASPCC